MTGYEIFVRKYTPPKAYRDEFTRVFGKEWLKWEPETLFSEIRRHWGVTPIEAIREKILALQTFLTTDLFWDDFLVFEKIILAFNDREVDHDLIQCCTPEELAYGMKMAMEVRNRGDFVFDIKAYIQSCHREAGVLCYYSDLMEFQPEYKDSYRRSTCSAVEARIDGAVPPPEEVNQDSPTEVQFAKTWDIYTYVGERLTRSGEHE